MSWYLGKNGIKWINDTPTVITGFADYVGEVMSSICDKNGDLLLYSNGDFIFLISTMKDLLQLFLKVVEALLRF
ncbi:MAG: hypothetical protein IPL25_03785 [Saprospiraceae bacterium]|nr:hypothetical protein [Candidatus Vicinibacter affinis]